MILNKSVTMRATLTFGFSHWCRAGFYLLVVLMIGSCKKYLEASPDKSLVIPSSLEDVQAVLDTYSGMNVYNPVIPVVAADEYYLPNTTYGSRNLIDQTNYIWDAAATSPNSWSLPYRTVNYANVVLQQLPLIMQGNVNTAAADNIRGQAFYFRAFSFYHLAQIYCRPYSSTASTDLGIALRLVPDIEEKTVRATVQQSYDQIISDFKLAVNLLPESVPISSRPNKAAAFGALARTYLSMRDYVNAGRYADSCLKHYSFLMNFNTLTATAAKPIARFNQETMFHSIMTVLTVPNATALIDTNLYRSYDMNDLRRTVYFANVSGGVSFKGSYDGTTQAYNPFCGIATDEIILTRAECSARAGLKDSAISDLNRLLVTRWKTGTFVPFTAIDAPGALSIILGERKKELLFRGLRWSDLRRFNLEGANITLKRIINNTVYTLSPNDLRWVMLIPLSVISITGIPQNPR